MRLFTLLLLLPLSLPVRAEPAPSSPCAKVQGRPCVALVLGGGGARGGAHIGVIKQLEAMRIPVDLVVGTSIGSFVGALYASGRSAAEIEELMVDMDWNQGYRDQVNRDEMSIRRKQQADEFNIQLGLGVGLDGAKLPSGVLRGQALAGLLQQALGTMPALANFDQLPIPYRAIATDLVSGEAVVLGSGNLATAVQASMAIPGVVQPLIVEEHSLVDGGIAAQVPVRIAQQLGAERVIAVEISTPGASADKLGSAVQIMDQLSYFLIRKNVEQDLAALDEERGDVLLIPELGELATFDFERLAEAVAIGEQAARQQRPQLSRLTLSERDYRRWDYARERPPAPPARIDKVVLHNQSRLADSMIMERLELNDGDPLDQQKIDEGIRRVYGLGTFERVTQELREANGEQQLHVTAQEKRWGPGYLDFLLRLENDFSNQQSHELGMAYTLTNISPYGGEWRNELVFGTNRALASELCWPLATSRWYLLGRGQYNSDFYALRDEQGESVGDMRLDDGALLAALGYNLADDHTLEIGLAGHRGSFELPASIDLGLGTSTPNFNRRGGVLAWHYDSLDSASLPTRGIRWQAQLERSKDELEWQQGMTNLVELDWLAAATLGNGHILRNQLRWQDYFNDDLQQSPVLFDLGGFLNLSGYPSHQLFGRHLRYGNLVYSYQLAANDFGAFRAPLYLGTSLEAGNVWDKASQTAFNELIWAGSVFVGWDSPLGPVYLGYGKAEGDWDSVYFYLGNPF